MNVFIPNLSALRAYGIRLKGTADNLANVNTPGYKAVRVQTVESKGGGVSVAVGRDVTPGSLLPEEPDRPGQALEGSNVDMAREMVDLIVTARVYQANARAVRILEETKGSVLDVVE